MGSINAVRVAKKVSEVIQRGELVDLGKIIENTGYTKQTSLKPSLVTNTKSYQTTLALESKPIIEGIQAEINRIKEEIATRDLSDEEYRTLIGSLDILTKNHQLLSGGDKQKPKVVLQDDKKARLLAILNDNA